MTDHAVTSPTSVTPRRVRPLPLIAAALGFLLFYLAIDFVAPNLASSALPMPDDPGEVARAWYAENQAAAVATGALQVLSVTCLGLFVTQLRRTAAPGLEPEAGRAARLGFVAVALMVLSSVLAWTLAALAPSASVATVEALRTSNFIAGGTAHVVALGIFVFLVSRLPGMTKPIRVLAWVAAIPAVLSLASLVVFEGAALILLGRLLCMIWTISASVSVARRLGRGRQG